VALAAAAAALLFTGGASWGDGAVGEGGGGALGM